MTEETVYLEAGDVAHMAGVSSNVVRKDAEEGVIEVAAMTHRGGRLFLKPEAERYVADRVKRGLLGRAPRRWQQPEGRF